ncbi:hypothetical protein RchiOBHm_Chr2g0148431 [Rosa chinensis]|uniref:Protein kinase domain-containing protein n=1 Tax=Rosa chinensis TaxID=74649 RepID=A0A2P6RZG3_ROSCH|nr:hypothetical protein RchiOBHm_Chr2g0148431 [Rosa chinensis]
MSWADFDKIGQGGFGAVYYAELTSKRKGRDETKRERERETREQARTKRRRRERREALA